MGDFKPILTVARRSPPTLSFFNLVEAHVLNSIREYHRLPEIRRALAYVQRELHVDRALVRKVFQTDGINLFVDHLGKLLNVTQAGQVAMREVLGAHLRRLEFDPDGIAQRLYPFTRMGAHGGLEIEDPRSVVFDCQMSPIERYPPESTPRTTRNQNAPLLLVRSRSDRLKANPPKANNRAATPNSAIRSMSPC